jgi:hypothetical protein
VYKKIGQKFRDVEKRIEKRENSKRKIKFHLTDNGTILLNQLIEETSKNINSVSLEGTAQMLELQEYLESDSTLSEQLNKKQRTDKATFSPIMQAELENKASHNPNDTDTDTDIDDCDKKPAAK